MSKKENLVIDDLNENVAPECRQMLDEWNETTLEIKKIILAKLKTLMAEDGTVQRIQLAAAITALGHAVGTLIAFMPDYATQDLAKDAFENAVAMYLNQARLEKLEEERV